jgi:cellulose synthase/poly-beta-1,6-N-acetylglucosamine synthase-like glycosyltransferase
MLTFLYPAAAVVLWTSIFGYVAALVVVAARRHSRAGAAEEIGTCPRFPQIAVVVPVRNEEKLVAAKLADLRKTDYPPELLAIVVVDGGSTDRTAAIVEAERAHNSALRLVRVDGSRGRADQLNAVLPTLLQEIVVVTDVDAELDPACIRALVESLLELPATDVVGARIRPASRLLEERIHWWLLSSLWWLEGEALGNGQVSGVCYALRKSAVSTLPSDCTADDIHFGLLASARGRQVRLCRTALATEMRVPQTLRELLTFRRRRGSGYLRELRRTRPAAAPVSWHLMQAFRLYHFFVMPLLATALSCASLYLLTTAQWQWPILAGFAFALPTTLAMSASTTLGEGRRWWRLGFAAGRLAGLVWFSLLALPRASAARLDKGN